MSEKSIALPSEPAQYFTLTGAWASSEARPVVKMTWPPNHMRCNQPWGGSPEPQP
jgi:hypothetical protein